ncbi:hypothetical protein CBR_g48857 [Chara braunii]|uniref:Uncharacterized protein n=1 Tax=Chara braunii TaxID=69332 RepID=A0A388M3I7_CHABU|nr:hypothetical protein CBR_g48857 [Chara braunii]|eukprot:GBG89150.1 hypothetical protein CBR_g48857 [Chara braunii]
MMTDWIRLIGERLEQLHPIEGQLHPIAEKLKFDWIEGLLHLIEEKLKFDWIHWSILDRLEKQTDAWRLHLSSSC